MTKFILILLIFSSIIHAQTLLCSPVGLLDKKTGEHIDFTKEESINGGHILETSQDSILFTKLSNKHQMIFKYKETKNNIRFYYMDKIPMYIVKTGKKKPAYAIEYTELYLNDKSQILVSLCNPPKFKRK